MHMLPLTRSLLPQAEEMRRELWHNSGKWLASIELEYRRIYGIGYPAWEFNLQILKAVLARAGNPAGAVEAMGDLDEFLGQVLGSFRKPTQIAMILRDAAELDLAADLLHKAESDLADDKERMIHANTLGTVRVAMGDRDEALKWFRKVRRLARRLGLPFLTSVEINIASTYNLDHKYRQAFAILERIEPAVASMHVRDRFGYLVLRSVALRGLGRFAEAQAVVLEALELGEAERGGLRLLEDRMTFQSKRETFTRQHSSHASPTATPGRRWSGGAIEGPSVRRPAAVGRLPLPPEAETLSQVEESLLAQKAIFERLDSSIRTLGPAFIDFDAINELRQFDRTPDIFESDATEPRPLSPGKVADRIREVETTLRNIRRKIEDARWAGGGIIVGEVLSFQECRRLLATS